MEAEDVRKLLESMGFSFVDVFEDDNGFDEYMYEKGDVVLMYKPETDRIVITILKSTRLRGVKLPNGCKREKGDYSNIVHCTKVIHVNGRSANSLKKEIERYINRVNKVFIS